MDFDIRTRSQTPFSDGKDFGGLHLLSVQYASDRANLTPQDDRAKIPCINRRCDERKQRDWRIYFLRNEHPSVRRAFPPVGWQRTVEQPAQMTTVCAWEKTVVMVKQPGHLTSMKKERGAGTRFCMYVLIPRPRCDFEACDAYLELVLASLRSCGGVEEIYGENLFRQHHVSNCIQIHQSKPKSPAIQSLIPRWSPRFRR